MEQNKNRYIISIQSLNIFETLYIITKLTTKQFNKLNNLKTWQILTFLT